MRKLGNRLVESLYSVWSHTKIR